MPPRGQRPPRPPLTHFLCLPLLTPTSTPQLRASIAHLQSVIGAREPVGEEADDYAEAQPENRSPPLVPRAAFRPLGTLHLTLGVMSLKEPEKLQGALELLEELDVDGMLRDVSAEVSRANEVTAPDEPASSIDGGQSAAIFPVRANANNENSSRTLVDQDESSAMVTEAEKKANAQRTSSPPPFPAHSSTIPSKSSPPISSNPSPPPLLISLRGLSSFPTTKPKNSTVLHTPPHDPTSRLLPLCHRILHPFKQAGYILDAQPVNRGGGGDDDDNNNNANTNDHDLTLHTTLVNTVYAKKEGRRRVEPAKKKNKWNNRPDSKLTFDATAVLELFNEKNGGLPASSGSDSTFTINHDGTETKSFTTATAKTQIPNPDSNLNPDQEVLAPPPPPPPQKTDHTSSSSSSTYTFASQIRIDRIQICEMGAKKLGPDPDNDKNNNDEDREDREGLGQKYIVVGEKKMTERGPGGIRRDLRD